MANSLITMQYVNDGQTLTTYNGRRISDYRLISVIIGATANDIRQSVCIDTTQWVNSLLLTSSHGASMENVSGVTFVRNSDTSITVTLTGSQAFRWVSIVGVLKN